MTRPDVSETEWADRDEWEPPSTPTDAPEADAAEQAQPLRPGDDRPAPPPIRPDVNEADAVEQSQVVVDDDDAYER